MYTSVGICTLCFYKKGHHKSLIILFFDDYPRAVFCLSLFVGVLICGVYVCMLVNVCVCWGGGGGLHVHIIWHGSGKSFLFRDGERGVCGASLLVLPLH